MSEEAEYTIFEINNEELDDAKKLAVYTLINEGILREREHTLAMLEELKAEMSSVDTGGFGKNSVNMSIRVKTIELIISRIKGENK